MQRKATFGWPFLLDKPETINYNSLIKSGNNQMNEFQRTLFANLMALCHDGQESFYYVDQSYGSSLYRIFLYRLASYTEFQQPGALECRGHVFRIDADGNPLWFSSMPMNTFFNHGENPFVMNLDLSTIVHIMDKLDGSLISTVRDADDSFFLKSKGSFHSDQARAATALLATPAYRKLHMFCHIMATTGFTVNMEYMAPDNQIVIGYEKATLKVLNVRHNGSGDYISRDLYELSDKFRVAVHALPDDGEVWLANTYKSVEKIEGYVARLSCGTWFKVKTELYCSLHHTKDSITIPRRLFEACVNGGADDLRAMFKEDTFSIARIDEMDEKVRKLYNHLHMNVHGFYNCHKASDRKTFALAGQADETVQKDGTFGLVMNLYLGKEADIAGFMVKNYKKYGVKDEADLPAEVE